MKLYKLTIDGKEARTYSDIRQARQTMNVMLAFGHIVSLEEIEKGW